VANNIRFHDKLPTIVVDLQNEILSGCLATSKNINLLLQPRRLGEGIAALLMIGRFFNPTHSPVPLKGKSF
jgi:hypothetical protein